LIVDLSDLSISITNKRKSKDQFHGNNCTEAELGFFSFTKLYTSYKRNRCIHMWKYLETVMYTWAIVSTYVGFLKGRCVHMWGFVLTSMYRFIQVSIGVVSIVGYFQGSLSCLRDVISTFES
jgi:hypothetical protein